MNFIKKAASALCVSMMFATVVTGCGGTAGTTASADQGATGTKSLETALTNTNALEGIHATATMNMNMTAMGETADIGIDMEMWQNKVAGSDIPEAKIDMTMDLGAAGTGSPIEAVVYMKDDSVYMEMLGQKMKMSMAEYATSGTDMDSMVNIISPEMIKSYTVSETDGKSVYDVVLNDEAYDTYLNDALAQAGQTEDAQVEMKKITTNITVENDYVTAQTMNMEFEMTVQGVKVPVVMDMEVAYINPGESVTIEFPDFTGYLDTTGASTGTMAA